jgi:adenine-specific DNA-methyltransferase
LNLKRQILSQMTRDQLKEVIEAVALTDVDKRSAEAMRAKLSRAHRVTPAVLLERLSEGEVKDLCDTLGVSSVGRRATLIARLLEPGASEFELKADEIPMPTEPSASGRSPRQARGEKKITRYTYDDIKEPRTPETGHTSLLPGDELVVNLPMDNGWSKAVVIGKLPEENERPVVVDMDPAADPVLFWAGKRSRREVPVLPLQRNEIVSESRIAQIIERARRAAEETEGEPRQGHLFADLEKTLRESDRSKRVEFYTHEEGWKNKLICGDSLHVMESLIHYENLRSKVQMIFMDPPYGIKYDSNFQQRVDSTKNDEKNQADDVLTIKAFRDTWTLGIHSYLSYLEERLYLCRELLAESGSIFLQIGDENAHITRSLLDEVFGADQFVSEVVFYKTSGKSGAGLDAVFDRLLWYAKSKSSLKYRQIYMPRPQYTLQEQYTLVELPDGVVRRITDDENVGLAPLPVGARRFMPDQLSSQGETEEGSKPFEFDGVEYSLPPNTHWKTGLAGRQRLAAKGRLYPVGKRLRYKRYAADFPLAPYTNIWDDTVISGFAAAKLYAVQTSPKVVERCIVMTTVPGDLVFDPTCGSGTTAYCAERLGRRWITCDTSRVAGNVARQRLISGTFEHFKTRNGKVSGNFLYKTVNRITLKSLAHDLEPEKVELVDQPEVDKDAVRVCGPFEVASLGRYSVEDWKGYVVREGSIGEAAKLENYIEVICRLYRKDAAIQGATGLVHAVAENEKEKIAISVGPLSGRVTAKQINDAVQDALASGILEVHVLGWAFEANVGEVKSQLEKRGKVKVVLIMIRPDTLAEGLKATQPEMLFSPLALPDIEVTAAKNGTEKQLQVTLKGVALFDRKRRTTEYKAANSGYVSAWYLDDDYDGDCFVDCQMFFDFKKAPNIKAALKAEVDPTEFTLKLASEPFLIRGYKRIAVKVVDVYGNESTIVRDLE